MKLSQDMPIRNFCGVLLCSLGLLMMSSCGGDSSTGPGNGNGGNGNGNGNGEPPDPTFANVQQIFTSSCGGSDCHIGNRQSGVRLDSYANVTESEGVNYGGPIVVAGEPDNSPIIDKISNSNPEFGAQMPEGRSPLSSDDINLIRDWITEGAQNN